jgi:hypothetical protein
VVLCAVGLYNGGRKWWFFVVYIVRVWVGGLRGRRLLGNSCQPSHIVREDHAVVHTACSSSSSASSSCPSACDTAWRPLTFSASSLPPAFFFLFFFFFDLDIEPVFLVSQRVFRSFAHEVSNYARPQVQQRKLQAHLPLWFTGSVVVCADMIGRM